MSGAQHSQGSSNNLLDPQAVPEEPFGLLELPDGPLRLILQRLPLRDKVAASFSCRELRRLVVHDPDPGSLGRLRVAIAPPVPRQPELCLPIALESHERARTDVFSVCLRAAAPDAERRGLLNLALSRHRCFSSFAVDVVAPEELSDARDEADYAAVFEIYRAALAALAPLLGSRPLTIAFSYPARTTRLPLGAQPAFLPPLLEPLRALRHKPTRLDLDLFFFVGLLEPDAFPVLSELTHLERVALNRVFSETDWPLAPLASLPSLSMDVVAKGESPGFFSALQGLTGLDTLIFAQACPIIDEVIAASLTRLTRLEIWEIHSAPFDLEDLSPLGDLFPALRSLLLGTSTVGPATVIPRIQGVPPRVSSLTLAFSQLDPERLIGLPLEQILFMSDVIVSLSDAALSSVGHHLTSLEFRLGMENVEFPYEFRLGPSLGALTRLRRLHILVNEQYCSAGPPRRAALQPRVSIALPVELARLSSLSELRLEGAIKGAEEAVPAHLRRRIRTVQEPLRRIDVVIGRSTESHGRGQRSRRSSPTPPPPGTQPDGGAARDAREEGSEAGALAAGVAAGLGALSLRSEADRDHDRRRPGSALHGVLGGFDPQHDQLEPEAIISVATNAAPEPLE